MWLKMEMNQQIGYATLDLELEPICFKLFFEKLIVFGPKKKLIVFNNFKYICWVTKYIMNRI